MKKVLFPILALVLALGLALPAAAHTESDPFVTDLIADGGSVVTKIDVGDVSVWNDGSNLYVKYETTGGWEITKTHLAVAMEESGIPQNRAGNPKVGQFQHSTSHAPPVTTYTYTIALGDLSVEPCEDVCIAAHAKVQKLGDVMTASLVTGAETDNVLVISENSTDPGYPLGYPESYSGTQTPSVVIQDTPNGHSGWPTITGAKWISDSIVEPPNVNEWRLFTRNFSLPSNATNISGTLHIDSDNAEAAKINGNPAAGLVYGEVYGAFIDDGEWRSIQHWPVGSHLQSGLNTLEVMVRNYYWLNMPGNWRNYTGLVYKIDYEYQLLTTETAWGDGGRFTEPGNWAMYFTYHVQGILTGTWLLDVNDGAYMHDMLIVTQSATGELTGYGGYPAGSGPPYPYPYNWTLTGQITGNSVTMTLDYQSPYQAIITGTVDSSWDSMSGGAGTGGVVNWEATRVP